MVGGWTAWVVFNVALAIFLTLDLAFFSGKVGRHKFKSSLYLALFWTVLGVGVGVTILLIGSNQQGVEYMAAYVAERALSLDNLFVFMVLFAYFKLPQQLESYALSLGIIGALVARAVFIAAGTTLISVFSWVLIPLGVFLLYTAFKLWFQSSSEQNHDNSIIIKAVRKIVPVTGDFDGRKLWLRVDGKLVATSLLLVVVALIFADALFAVDSIPTVIGISKDPFVIWSSNAMAVLGMRPLFFALVGLAARFRYLHYGLALVLAYIGVKLVMEELWHIFTGNAPHLFGGLWDTIVPLAVIVFILVGSIVFSMVKPSEPERLP